MSTAETAVAPVDYRTDPSQYKHWKLSFNGPVATLGIDIAEEGYSTDGQKVSFCEFTHSGRRVGVYCIGHGLRTSLLQRSEEHTSELQSPA